jgi:hypothetical protein
MFHRRPGGISTLGGSTGNSLAKLSALEGAARSMQVGIAPLIALQALGSKEAVSWMYLAAAVFTMAVTLNFSILERILQRRWVLTLGGVFVICASFLFYFAEGWLFALAIGLRSAAASLFSVCLSLYVMEFINKADLTWTESRRVAFGGAAWLIGPTLGLWLWCHTSAILPFIFSAVLATGMLFYFWRLRLGGSKVIQAAKTLANCLLHYAYAFMLLVNPVYLRTNLCGRIRITNMDGRRFAFCRRRANVFQPTDPAYRGARWHTKCHYCSPITQQRLIDCNRFDRGAPAAGPCILAPGRLRRSKS